MVHAVLSNFLRKLYRGVGTTRSRRLERAAAEGRWDLLLSERPEHPSKYRTADSYFRDALVTNIVRKLRLDGDESKRVASAEADFLSSEEACARTNARLHRFVAGGPYSPGDEPVIELIARWRKEVRRALGRVPDTLTPVYSGGSTLSDKGIAVTIPDKMSSDLTLYKGSLAVVKQCFEGVSVYQIEEARIVRSNRFFCVPKDSSTHRGCCVEASANVMLQLAVDKHIRRSYERLYQVDMSSLYLRHRRLAQQASIDGKMATIDLSKASDMIARQAVKLACPTIWYDLLDSLRATHTRFRGRDHHLQKFSSMGNGYTWILQTVLFQSLARAIGSKSSSCFGDDIIIESELAPLMIKALSFFGFQTNEKKTFCEGPFRESCGGDYFEGVPVRGHFLKEVPDEPQQWVALANGLRRADPAMRYVKAAWWYCIDQLPVDWRNFTSDASLGDFAIYAPERAEPVTRIVRSPDRRNRNYHFQHPCWRGKVPVLKKLPITFFDHEVQLISRSAGFVVGEFVSPRDSIVGYKTAWVSAIGISRTDFRP